MKTAFQQWKADTEDNIIPAFHHLELQHQFFLN